MGLGMHAPASALASGFLASVENAYLPLPPPCGKGLPVGGKFHSREAPGCPPLSLHSLGFLWLPLARLGAFHVPSPDS